MKQIPRRLLLGLALSTLLVLCCAFALQSSAKGSAEDEKECFIVANISIHDRAEYGKYEAGFSAIFQKYGGTIVAGSEDPEVLEGKWPYTRFVMARFPSCTALKAWYNSDEYQDIVQHRFAASNANIIVVDAR